MTNDPMFNLPAAAARSGLSRYVLARAIAAGSQPAVNVGTGAPRHYRVAPADLDAYVQGLRAGVPRD